MAEFTNSKRGNWFVACRMIGLPHLYGGAACPAVQQAPVSDLRLTAVSEFGSFRGSLLHRHRRWHFDVVAKAEIRAIGADGKADCASVVRLC